MGKLNSSLCAVLFDLDETLLDRTQSILKFAQGQYARFYPHLAHVPEERYVRRFVELDARGAVWKDRVYEQLVAEEGIIGLGWQSLLDDYVRNFAAACIGFPLIDETLRQLRADGFALGIVTNGRSPFQERNIEALGIASYFDAILVSEAEGVRKPEPEIFLRAAQRLGFTPAQVIFVGDNAQADVAGAQRCGMKAIWFMPRAVGECLFADGVCGSMAELRLAIAALCGRD